MRWGGFSGSSGRVGGPLPVTGSTHFVSLTTTQGHVQSVSRRAAVARVVSQASVATLSTLKVFLRALSASQGSTGVLARHSAAVKTYVSSLSTAVVRSVFSQRFVSSHASSLAVRLTSVRHTSVQASVAFLGTLSVSLRTLTASIGQAASHVRTLLLARVVPQSHVGTANKAVSHSVLVAQGSESLLVRLVTRTVSAVQSLLATLLSRLPGAAQPVTIDAAIWSSSLVSSNVWSSSAIDATVTL